MIIKPRKKRKTRSLAIKKQARLYKLGSLEAGIMAEEKIENPLRWKPCNERSEWLQKDTSVLFWIKSHHTCYSPYKCVVWCRAETFLVDT